MPQVWRLFKGGVYLKVDEIKSCINYNVDIFPIKLTELTIILFFWFWLYWGGGAFSRAVLVNFFLPNAALIQGLHLIRGDAYSSKYSY